MCVVLTRKIRAKIYLTDAGYIGNSAGWRRVMPNAPRVQIIFNTLYMEHFDI